MTPYVDDTDFTLYVGDVREVLAVLPAESVHCCVTSPPYWGLRDYGTGSWEGGDDGCDHMEELRSSSYNVGFNERWGNAAGAKKQEERGRRPFKDVCGKCGARRVDHQLGLEPTPEEYVANMVNVFREVRRVLRRDGTCWLNLGDGYSHGGNGSRDPEKWPKQSRNDHRVEHAKAAGGTKPKDLMGIPWKVAFALQQPYYTGTIKDERDRIWLAAMVEAEGCMFLHKRKTGQSNGQGYVRKNDSYGAGLEVASTDRVIVERCMAIAGIGSICEQGPNENARRKQTIYRWNVRSNECRDIIRELYPHFIAKQHEARLLIGCPSSGDKAEAAWAGLKEIHGGGVPAVDFAAPESLFEPGWYVRSDIVWSKANPMPESVTDRPTKAHEYLFLLTKSARYYFDQDAIREPSTPASIDRHSGPSEDPFQHARMNGEVVGQVPHRGSLNVNGGGANGRNKRSVWETKQTGRPRGARHTLDDDYFSVIDTEQKAYWLGFLYADGYVGSRHVDLMLAERDLDHVLRFRAALNSSANVNEPRDGRARVVISSRVMADDLRGLGFPGRVDVPAMPSELVRHFVRGVFDGDGSIWKTLLRSGKWRYAAQMLGHELLLSTVRENLGLRGKPKFHRGIHKIAIASRRDIAALYDYLYADATIWLPRKRASFPQAQHVSKDVWSIATEPYPDAHFATFPQALVEPCVLAGTSERGCCPVCGAPWERGVVATGADNKRNREDVGDWIKHKGGNADGKRSLSGATYKPQRAATDEWRPTCTCAGALGAVSGQVNESAEPRLRGSAGVATTERRSPIPCTVLDPFMGSGTTALVARRHGRRSIGIELNAEYAELAAKRLQQLSLLA